MNQICPDLFNYFVKVETKLEENFSDVKFNLSGYEVRVRRYRDKHGCGLIQLIRQGFISRRLKECEPKNSEYSKFTKLNKKLKYFRIYRPAVANNLNYFFDEMTISFSKDILTFGSIMVMDDFNIYVKTFRLYVLVMSRPRLYTCLNVKELLARSRREI